MADISRRTILGVALTAAACSTPPPQATRLITVVATPGSVAGKLTCQGQVYDCMLGRSGIVSAKREGDGGTPVGLFPLREIRYRPDRLTTPPTTGLLVIKTLPSDGWCDDPADPNYNRLVTLPYDSSAETLWRADGLYDLLAVIGYNDAPPAAGAGSAIFLHVMRQSAGVGQPTSGCISLARADLLAVLAMCTAQSAIRITKL